MNFADLVTISPLIVAVLTAAAVLFVDLVWPGRDGPAIGVALIGLAVAALVTIQVGAETATAFGGSYKVDALTTFLDQISAADVARLVRPLRLRDQS